MQPTTEPVDGSEEDIRPGQTLPRTTWLILGGIASAGLASTCCLGPAVLGLVGLGSLGAATAFEPYRPYFAGLTLTLLAAGFYMVYRRRPETPRCCRAEEGGAAPPGPSRRVNVALWGGSGLALLLIGYPYVANVATPASARGVTSPTAPTRTVALSISGMTCGSCESHVRKLLLDDRSVVDAEVSYAEGTAHVQVRADTVDAEHLVTLVQSKTHYRAVVISKVRGR